MRNYSVTRFGKRTSIFKGKFIFIKKIIKKVFRKDLAKKITYKDLININDISIRFQMSDKTIELIQKHENSIKNQNIKFPLKIKKVIDREKIKSPFTLKKFFWKCIKMKKVK